MKSEMFDSIVRRVANERVEQRKAAFAKALWEATCALYGRPSSCWGHDYANALNQLRKGDVLDTPWTHSRSQLQTEWSTKLLAQEIERVKEELLQKLDIFQRALLLPDPADAVPETDTPTSLSTTAS